MRLYRLESAKFEGAKLAKFSVSPYFFKIKFSHLLLDANRALVDEKSMKTIRQTNMRGGIARLVQDGEKFHAILIVNGRIIEEASDINSEAAWSKLVSQNTIVKQKAQAPQNIDHAIYSEVAKLIEKSPHPIYLTGRAGTGKTTFLRHFLETSELNSIIIAPTGIAALNAGGQTAHSLFKFPPNLIRPQDVKRVREGRLLRAIDLLVIDEISMVRADLMDGIDRSLRLHRGINLPFGGVKLLCVGDAAQLPPVVNREEGEILNDWFNGPYFFDAPSVQSMKWRIIELTHAFRQTEYHFLEILNRLRHGAISRDDFELLEQRIIPIAPDVDDNGVILTTTNDAARRINEREMAALPEKPAIYCGEADGVFDERLFPTEINLELKVGAKVMMLRNDIDRRFVNGTLARVIETNDETVKVKIGRYVHEIEPVVWERYQYELDDKDEPKRKTVGTFTQLPIRPAWALTIHKAQGLSFDKVHIDFGRGAFAHGQTYVAFSRCRTLEGLTISRNVKKSDIAIDERSMAFLDGIETDENENFRTGWREF